MTDVVNPIQRASEERMDMRTLAEVLIRRRWIILIVSMPVVLVALIGTLRSSQIFRARGTMMINMSTPASPTLHWRAINVDMVLSSAAELGMSSPVAKLAAAALADSLPMLRQEMPLYFGESTTVEDLQGMLLGGADCTHVGESNLLNLAYSHPNAQVALLGASALAQGYIDFHIQAKRNLPAVEYYSEQIATTQAELDSLVGIRTAALTAGGVMGVQADLKMTVNQIRGLESEYFHARSRREGLEASKASLEAVINEDPDFVPTVMSGRFSSLNRLKGEIDTSIAKLVKLRQTYQDSSVWVMREVEQLETTRVEFIRERGSFMRALEVQLAEARTVEQSYQRAVATQTEGLRGYPEIRGQVEMMDLRIQGLKALLQNLQLKRGEVRLTSESDYRVSDIVLIEEPALDVPVGRGRKMLYLIISVVLALSMGLVAAFFVESNDHRIYDRRRAELYLEVPVLGSLPDTSGRIKG